MLYGRVSSTVFLLFLFTLVSLSCADRTEPTGNRSGGIFKTHLQRDVNGFAPWTIEDNYTQQIAALVHEGLVEYAPPDRETGIMELVPCLALDREIDEEENSVAFRLREGVRFQNDPCFPGGRGREIVPEDFGYSIGLHLRNHIGPYADELMESIEGAEAYSKGQSDSISGIGYPGGNSIKFILRCPVSSFLRLMASPAGWVIPRESVESYADAVSIHPVGAGPFRLISWDPAGEILLGRNDNYWERDGEGIQLPYVDAVELVYTSAYRSYLLFRNRNLHVIYTGEEARKKLAEEMGGARIREYKTTLLNTIYLAFRMDTGTPYAENARVRRAMACLRPELDSEHLTSSSSFFPPGVVGYGERAAGECGIERARELLAEAGHPGGKGLPPITLQVLRETEIPIMERETELLGELGIRVRLKPVKRELHWKLLREGESEFFRTGMITDSPEPETFLSLFLSNDPANLGGYVNPRYDRLYERLIRENDKNTCRTIVEEMIGILEKDAPLIVMWHGILYETAWGFVRDYHYSSNPIMRRYYKYIWLDDDKG